MQHRWNIRIGAVVALAVACFHHAAAAEAMPTVEEPPHASAAISARPSQAKAAGQQFAITESDKLILQGVNFHTGTAEITPASQPALATAVKVLKENPAARVQIVGHTDSTGRPADNQRLSEQRAQAVKAALVQRGVDPARLETVGHGASRPLTHNSTPAGRAMNRRVTLSIIDSTTGAAAGPRR